MNDATPDAAAQVALVLERAGLPVTDEERARLIRLYPTLQGWAQSLRLPEIRHADPALIYAAADLAAEE